MSRAREEKRRRRMEQLHAGCNTPAGHVCDVMTDSGIPMYETPSPEQRWTFGFDLAKEAGEEIVPGDIVCMDPSGKVYHQQEQPVLTMELLTQTMRDLASRGPSPQIELVSPQEADWRNAHPGSTHFDYLMNTNKRFAKWYRNHCKAKWRSRRNQPGKIWRKVK